MTTALTILPAPRREPPFDDEVPARHLHLVSVHDQELPFLAPSDRRLTDRADAFDQRATSRSDLPDPATWGRLLVVAVCEALNGRRPVGQLVPLMSAALGAHVAKDKFNGARARGWAGRMTLRHVRVSEPADGVAELAAVIGVGHRARAMAARLEGLDGRWQCTRLQLG